MTMWVKWIEPFGGNNEPVYMMAPADTVVSRMRVLYLSEDPVSDAQMLDEFVIVNWASLEEKPDDWKP